MAETIEKSAESEFTPEIDGAAAVEARSRVEASSKATDTRASAEAARSAIQNAYESKTIESEFRGQPMADGELREVTNAVKASTKKPGLLSRLLHRNK